MSIDLDELREEIKEMRYWHPLFRVLKEELEKQGYWKNRSRGNPRLGYEVMNDRLSR